MLVLPEDVSIVAYPEEFKNWETQGLDGVEVYNVFTNSKRINPLVAFFDVLVVQAQLSGSDVCALPGAAGRGFEVVGPGVDPDALTAVGGNDAHANIGVSLRDSAGNSCSVYSWIRMRLVFV